MPEERSSAIDRIEELLEYYPDDVLLHLSLGRRYMEADMYPKAVEVFRRAVDLDPAYSVAYRYLAEAQEKAGDLSGAARTYERGIGVAREQGDIQAAREMEVFLKRLTRGKN